MNLLSGQFDLALPEGTCAVVVVDESAKFNLNLLKNARGELDRTRIDQLLRLIDLLNRDDRAAEPIAYDLVPSIVDWIDPDDEKTVLPFVSRANGGAESDYYARFAPPYRCPNTRIETIEELLLVKGMTPETFTRIRDYITAKGDGKIDINHAPRIVVESLSEKMDPALAQMIVDHRNRKPFGALAELRDIPGMTDAVYQTLKKSATTDPADRHYTVLAEGRANGRVQIVAAMIRKNHATNTIDVIVYTER